jgi:hypothetical protein
MSFSTVAMKRGSLTIWQLSERRWPSIHLGLLLLLELLALLLLLLLERLVEALSEAATSWIALKAYILELFYTRLQLLSLYHQLVRSLYPTSTVVQHDIKVTIKACF